MIPTGRDCGLAGWIKYLEECMKVKSCHKEHDMLKISPKDKSVLTDNVMSLLCKQVRVVRRFLNQSILSTILADSTESFHLMANVMFQFMTYEILHSSEIFIILENGTTKYSINMNIKQQSHKYFSIIYVFEVNAILYTFNRCSNCSTCMMCKN